MPQDLRAFSYLTAPKSGFYREVQWDGRARNAVPRPVAMTAPRSIDLGVGLDAASSLFDDA
jgi:hypothetical protein